MAIQLTRNGMAGEKTLLPTRNAFALDYIQIYGTARLLMRDHFGNKMRNFLADMSHPLDVMARIGAASDVGTHARNEDSAVALMAHFGDEQSATMVILAGVADGVGGDANGHMASALTIQALTESVVSRLAAFGADMRGIELSALNIESLLIDAISVAHYQIKRNTAGGSSTLTCALVIDRTAYIAHVGDCRAYLLNTEWKDMEIITQDHRRERKWQGFQIAANKKFTPHPHGYVLTRALGKNDQSEVDVTRRTLVNGTRLLLCSNGIWEYVSPAAIYATVLRTNQPQDSCEELVTLALAGNAYDDMTAVLIEMPD